jgi:L-ascorbate metabolism protein UlaG (beta-lactamase superfamily)
LSGAEFPKHFDGKRFYNPGAPQALGFGDVLRWKLSDRPEKSPSFIADVEQSIPPQRVEGSQLRVTLVNHSTVLLQQQGMNILTDPIWSERTSPLSWIGPRRRRRPGVAWENLPPIDVVLLSHNHYDHMDLPTLRRLARRGESTFVVPVGCAALLGSEKIGPVHELDWGEGLVLAGESACPTQTPALASQRGAGALETPLRSRFGIHSVPAFHFSGRGLHDRNKTLWCGYVLAGEERVVYFAGDTAFGPHFGQIREKFGTPRLALLPIGAYLPRWFMSPVHMGPDDAVRAHQILGAETSIAIHHGTFQLADDGVDTPKKELATAAGGNRFLALNNGQFADIP